MQTNHVFGRREIKDLIIGCILLLHRKWLELDLPSFDHFIGNFHGNIESQKVWNQALWTKSLGTLI